MTAQASLMWFRQDLRLRDNPALTAAANSGPILPVYILDDTNSAPWQLGAASRWWLHQSLNALNMQLNNRLMLLRGDPRKLIPALAADYGIEKIFWNRCYEPWRSQRDSELKQTLKDSGLSVSSSNASLLIEPWLNLKDDGTPYKVFTPFYKKALSKGINLDPVLSAEPTPEFIQTELAANRLDALEQFIAQRHGPRRLSGRPAAAVLPLHVGTVLPERQGDLDVAVLGRAVQRRVPVRVGQIDVRAQHEKFVDHRE